MDLKTIKSAIEQIANERGLSVDEVIEAVEGAIASAYKKEYRKKTEVVKASFDTKTGNMKFWLVKTVVDPNEVKMPEEGEEVVEDEPKTPSMEEEGEQLIRYNPDRHIFVEEAQKTDPKTEIGDDITFPLETYEEFGRIAAQTAKQVILQNVREAERESIRKEFEKKEGEMVSGTIQRYEKGHVYVDIGRAVGVMFQNDSVPGEHYRTGQRMRFYILAVQQEDRKRPGIVLSRAHPNFVAKLLELEVPEIAEGVVEIKRVAREPGSRTKVAVLSNQEGIDPVGSVVGQRGARIMAVINELGNEKIDVVEWSEDPEEIIANSLSPAKVKYVEAKPRREALVLVPEDQLSLAIGRGGQNVRLAAKLSGWKIDVRSQSSPDEQLHEGVAGANGDSEAGHGELSPEEESGESPEKDSKDDFLENKEEGEKEKIGNEEEVLTDSEDIESENNKNSEEQSKGDKVN